MQDCIRLQELNLAHNNIQQLPNPFDKFSHLVKINLSHNPIKKLPKLAPSLLELHCRKTSLQQIDKGVLQQLPKLQFLDLRYNDIQTFPEELFSLLQLKKLKGLLPYSESQALLRFLKMCKAHQVPVQLRSLLYQVYVTKNANSFAIASHGSPFSGP